MYEIFFTQTANEQLKNLSENIRNEIGMALERVRIRPFKFVKRLVNSAYYRLRVGSYRVILDIQSTALIILVVKIGHRGGIYK